MRRGRRPAGGIVVAAVAAALVTGAVPASAAGAAEAAMPGFLEPSDMPPDPFSAWYWSSGPSEGPYQAICAEALVLPEGDVWNATYGTPETAGGSQVSVVFPTEAAAAGFGAQAEASIAGCEARMEQEQPSRPVTFWDHGAVAAEEGAHVYGIGFQGGWGYQNQLVSVGRDGDTVTIVSWESNWGDPPVAAFKETTRVAVNKLR
ncbi:hypothetical protein [Streptomyces sp. NBC_01237]|uniref:hypothetical protein n=1 Tax=Streptomyces sp. NBC_01237 TaxID=2903790 RepID=UPI002DD89780|nr:hypothetical protein [Streptomyces sp. NBC_01237]WRZ71568.1 hypothetical protein OG251_08065 [Streptomyces sp. NBC_01237]